MWSRDRRSSSHPEVERRSGSPTALESLAVRTPAKTFGDLPLHRDERGNAMTEYALILALIAVVAFGLVGAVGDATLDLYTDISNVVHDLIG